MRTLYIVTLMAIAPLTSLSCTTPGPHLHTAEQMPAQWQQTALSLIDQLVRCYRAGDCTALSSLVAPDYLGTAPGVQ
jgi:hypothetical protein